MSNRVKENTELLSVIIENNKNKQKGTSEELTCWHLGTIASLLADISKSLAVIADKLEKEE
jgi:hypothetical protein